MRGKTHGVDATRIVSRVYQGSKPPLGPMVGRSGFDVLVLCAEEIQPDSQCFPGVDVLRAGIDDAELSPREWMRVVRAADMTAARVRSGQRVLITCHMGLNRSGIVTAVTLHMLTGQPGDAIVEHIQSRRSGALCNPSFVHAIRRLR